ncbi:MAG TPA: cold shock domain-containing protein [Marinagarivorans sp.]|nr:cold shock domain-containing protein [Cellvibrionaceae bacterium]HMY38052.1 cold shock domain-containing protein [Marinagarivorans sp.]HNG58497.1 cold shock domain-containing protein [Cellvibrionaceae bacterium]
MKGTVKTFLPEKNYGFIKGDDGKDYFFHGSEFIDKSQVAKICEEVLVDFDQEATPKGYKAKKCSLVSPCDVLTYVTPDEVILSKTSSVQGWEIIELGSWTINGSSPDSPDSARKTIIDRAASIGANALINYEYYKTTGSQGNYKYSVHNVRGQAVTVAKKNSIGKHHAEDLKGLNQRAEEMKIRLIERTKESKRFRNKAWWFLGFLSFLSLFIFPFVAILFLIIGYFIGQTNEYGRWLQRM